MNGGTVETTPGNEPIDLPGFSYLPRFISDADSSELLSYFGSLSPLWEHRHQGEQSARQGQASRRLTRPVYWLGAWQFASLGYYAEPDHLEDKCLRAEPFPPVMTRVLELLRSQLHPHLSAAEQGALPNTCLINFYGSELSLDAKGRPQPVDLARLRMHRDGEPGPVIMFSFGQPAQFEFVDPIDTSVAAMSMWLKHRSAVILSGPHYKDHLYHRVTRVRFGQEPAVPQPVPDFRLRRISVSFRYVPETRIKSLGEFPREAREKIEPYVAQLAKTSAHFRQQLEGAR